MNYLFVPTYVVLSKVDAACDISQIAINLDMPKLNWITALNISVTSSVTRLGDLLDFGQLFKAFGNN